MKLSHCYNEICRSSTLPAQALQFPETMQRRFHPIRSLAVGEGQERWGGGNATWEVVSVSKSKLLGDILQHNHPLCLCSSAHMAHIQPVTPNHCYFLTCINKNKPNFCFSMWGKMLPKSTVKRPEAALKITAFVGSSLLTRNEKKLGEVLPNSTSTHVLLMEYFAENRTAKSFVHTQSRCSLT